MAKKMKWAVVEVGGKNVLRLTTAKRKSLRDVKADLRVFGARRYDHVTGVCHKYFARLMDGWSRFEFGQFTNSLAEDSLRELNDSLQLAVWRRSMFLGSDDDALDYLLDLGVPDSLIVQVL